MRPVVIFLALVAGTSQAQGWLPGSPYRLPIDVSTAAPLLDHQLLITLDTATQLAAGRMRLDCADLRVTGDDGTSVLPLWLESGCGSAQARLWVRAPSLPGTARLYVYFGDPGASSVSDGYATHLFYEPFDENPADSGRWQDVHRATNNGGEFVWDGGEVWLTEAQQFSGGGGTFAFFDGGFDDGWAVSFRFRVGGSTNPNAGGDGLALGFFHAGNRGQGNELGVRSAGYAVELDAQQGPGDTSPRHIAIVTTVDSTSGYTHHAQYDTPAVEDDAWHSLLVEFHDDRLDVSLDDAGTVLTHSQAWSRSSNRLLFGAGCGLLTNVHRIDDVILRRFVRPVPGIAVGSLEVGDAGVEAAIDGGPVVEATPRALRVSCGCGAASPIDLALPLLLVLVARRGSKGGRPHQGTQRLRPCRNLK